VKFDVIGVAVIERHGRHRVNRVASLRANLFQLLNYLEFLILREWLCLFLLFQDSILVSLKQFLNENIEFHHFFFFFCKLFIVHIELPTFP